MTVDGSVLTVPGQLAARAAERPRDTALRVVDVGELSYAEWESRSTAVAMGLIELGLGRGDRVVLVADLGGLLSFAVAYVGVQKAGGTPVVVSRGAGLDHLERVHHGSRAVGVIGDAADAAVSGWRVGVGELESGGYRAALPTGPRPEDAAEILYTSGTTTGLPRGVYVSHANWLFTQSPPTPGAPKRVVVHALEPGSQVGQGLLLQALDGAPREIVALPAYQDDALFDAVERYHGTQLVLVPLMVLSLLDHGIPRLADISSLRLVRTTSAHIGPEALKRLDALIPHAVIENIYSTTQAWPAFTRIRFSPDHQGSVGRSRGPALIRIVNEAGDSVPVGSSGFVELTMPGAPMRRYVDGEADDGTFRPDGWVRTGDLGSVDPDGYLYLGDRASDVINAGGTLIGTLELERVIETFPGVREAAVVGLRSRTLGEYPVAAIRAASGIDLEALDAFLRKRLGGHAPRHLTVVDEFPRNALGKVLKRELREQLGVAVGVPSEGASPRRLTAVADERVREIWSEALQMAVPDDATFYALGGNSLSGARVIARVRAELGRAVSHRDLEASQDVREFARRVETAGPWHGDDLGPIRPAEPEGL